MGSINSGTSTLTDSSLTCDTNDIISVMEKLYSHCIKGSQVCLRIITCYKISQVAYTANYLNIYILVLSLSWDNVLLYNIQALLTILQTSFKFSLFFSRVITIQADYMYIFLIHYPCFTCSHGILKKYRSCFREFS